MKKNARLIYLIFSFLVVLIGLIIFVSVDKKRDISYTGPAPAESTIRIGKGSILQILLSEDQKYLAVVTSIGVYTYDARTFEELSFFQPSLNNDIYHVVFWESGASLRGWAGYDNYIEWNVLTGEIVREFDLHAVNQELGTSGHKWAFGSYPVALREVFLPNYLTGSSENKWILEVVNLETIEIIQSFIFYEPAGDGELVQDDKKLLVIDRYPFVFSFYDIESGELDYKFQSTTWSAEYALSSDKNMLAIETGGQILIIDLENYSQIQRIFFIGELQSVLFSPNGKSIGIGTTDKNIAIWDIDSGEHFFDISFDAPVDKFSWGYNSRSLSVVQNEILQIVDIRTGKVNNQIVGSFNGIESFSWAPDSEKLISLVRTKNEEDQLWLWDIHGNMLLNQKLPIENADSSISLQWSPVEDIIGVLTPKNSELILINSVDLTISSSLVLEGYSCCFSWSPDGQMIAVGYWDRRVDVIDLSGEVLHSFSVMPEWLPSPEFPTNPIVSIAWSPDGKLLAAGMWDGPAFVWNMETTQLLYELPHKVYTAFSYFHSTLNLDWSPDSTHLIASFNHEVRIKVTEDGSYQIVPSIYYTIWDMQTGEETSHALTENVQVSSLSWNSQSNVIAISEFNKSTKDYAVNLWRPDYVTDVLIGELPVLFSPIHRTYQLTWSPDGTSIASLSGDGTIIIWSDVNLDQ